MSKAQNRDEMLRRAARTRAQIIAYLNEVDDFVTATKIYDDSQANFMEIGADFSTVRFQLASMANNGLILSKERVGRGGVTFAKKNLNIREAAVNKPTKVDVKIKPLKEGKVPAYKIDVVKDQKRVRITIDDIMFDIGVVNA